MEETKLIKEAVKALIEMAKSKNRDSKITTKAGATHVISGHSVQDQHITFDDVALHWTDGTRTYFIVYNAIDHVVVV